ncbi:MAG: hypothetical protein ACOZB0_02410 [Pseudomonadota bacterium]
MDAISSALAVNQAMLQQQLAIEMARMAMQSQQQMVAMLSEVAVSAPSANPAHLGQLLDTAA